MTLRSIAHSPMSDWMLRTGALLEPLVSLMKSTIEESVVVQSDDTTTPTLGLVRGRAKDARL